MGAVKVLLVVAGVGAVVSVGVAMLVVQLAHDAVKFVYAGG